METAGPRGKSSFAKQLELSPSTYDYYEASRVPPAEVLVRIARITGVDLRWLLTGEPAADGAVAADHPVVQRAVAMLADRPDAAAPLAAFLDVLTAAQQFPVKQAQAGSDSAGRAETNGQAPEADATGDDPAALAEGGPSGAPEAAGADVASAEAAWIPILGRSAAGVAHFWADGAEADGLTTLNDLIARQPTARAARRPATACGPDGGEPTPVQIVTLTAPDARDVAEFIAAPGLKGRYGDAFALRIDGDSMAPEIRHGDVVIVSPQAEARDGRAAIVQLAGQIGVTCKLLRRRADEVHLVPINDRYEVGTFAAADVVWALRVLARVRGG